MLELKPMLSALWRNKISAMLIAMQLALTLAIISNIVVIVQDRIGKITRPTGIAVEEIIAINVMAIPQDYDMISAASSDLKLLRELSHVKDASVTQQVPLSQSGSAGVFYTQPNQEIGGVVSNRYNTDPHFINTLGLNLIAGRNFTDVEMQYFDPNEIREMSVAIITKQFAEKLYPNQDPIGKPLYDGNNHPIEIIGVVERHLGAWVGWSNAGNVAFFPVVRNTQDINYLVRTESGKRNDVLKVLEEKLSERDPQRVIKTKVLTEYVARSYARDNLMVKVLSIVAAMLSFIVALGIVGLTIFWINQRAKQIGVRRALGATRTNISRYFLIENGMIASLGIAVGSAAALIANQYMVRDYSQPTLTIAPLVVCALLVLLVSLVAALAPALRAANISPATATRSI
ncbi:ABC transporter permease [Microbulbifer sp. JMSA004]|uniref:ABC transporter permease n=1 Tax=unclassified Microbulbifer TaxID=2619833 RepID=UPI0024ADA9B1|nr:FtsX-like permease family protein [Microbulbifer sp. VAAF005]WHI48631.1 FtsX-like permease family protein [Microbulbifer sp. VAAF005]